MTDSNKEYQDNHIELTADIIAAYVSNNSVAVGSLHELLSSVHAALSGLTSGGSAAAEADKIQKATAAQIKKSITPDALISFEDGKPYRTLKRHLTIRGLTPEAYRAKHGLHANYPMTSAGYSAARSALAKELGLGKLRKGVTKAKAAVPEKAAVEVAAQAPDKPKKAGRPRKTAVAA
ncbi:Ros/MucR family transcriptional regulator [Methylobacterium sp. CM6241]